MLKKPDKPKCPHCKGVISNLKELYFNKLYQCGRCKGKYYIIKEPEEVYPNFLDF